MRLIQLLFLLLLFNSSYGQLSISPSVTGDSYIYVNNEVLFIEDGIDLKKNHQPSTQASIYLRSEAQILQGEKTTNKNSGEGLVSVFQEGTSNAFDYNYWSLPVANVSANKSVSEILYEPLDITRSRKALVTSELNGTADPLTISKRWLHKFSGIDYLDWRYIGDLFDLLPGEGFTMKGTNGTSSTIINGVQNNTGSSQRYDFRGRANDGEFQVRIMKDQSLLVGNPYPSALHLRHFLFNNTSTTGIAYFWDSKDNGRSHYLSDYEGGYGAYSPGANAYVPAVFKKFQGQGNIVNATGETGDIIPREFAPVAQGFMLIGSADGYVTFTNRSRIYIKENSENSGFKSASANLLTSEVTPNLRLDVEINDLYTRPLILAFREDATKNADWAMDAMTLNRISSDVGWFIDEDFYIINVQPFSTEEKIPIIVNMASEGEVTFNLNSTKAFEPEKVFLFDSERNTQIDLKSTGYRVFLAKGEYEQRFSLGFQMPVPLPQDTEEEQPAPENVPYKPKVVVPPEAEIQILQNNAEGLLQIKAIKEANIDQVTLYDLKGSKIFSQKITEKEQELSFSTNGLSDAVYILKIITSDKKEISKKISIKKQQ
ncbi:T9SS type A sorting domain-containing protein [Autumnicola edwardsiae]|uniref:T9SS type A sorting domain-containing protein n=1 Tax=Autumnicola edwardsiae TaxID=3075594 RepID=A0ABU3CW65_9FLAO|nr:T9SS type A sorting domain-containing protein [Zunongwangia sp. F297]MDT0650616.1 T9SS type A sorting domain-containing protein [Zunongwangia sp. F297]